MNITSVVTGKYQVVIPKRVRQRVKVAAGDKVIIEALGDLIVIHKQKRAQSWTDALLGLGKDVWKNLDPVTYVRKEREAWQR